MIVESYPGQLIAEDKWGELPILYAFWSNAPREIIQYLIDSHISIHPRYELKWDQMLEVLSMANASRETIQNMLDARRISFPDQAIAWDGVLDKLAEPITSWKQHYASRDTFRFLLLCSASGRVDAIGLRQWRAKVMSQIGLVRDGHRWRKADLARFRSTLAHYESEYRKLKEATSILELALWKARIAETKSIDPIREGVRSEERTEADESECRSRCRISCGADNVVENVLPFLLPAKEPPMAIYATFHPVRRLPPW